MWRECFFFPDDGQCASRSCAVDECEEEEFKNVCSGHESGNIDVSLDGHNFQKWLEDGDPWTNDADVMNVGEHMNYVDLMKNPERFTGYSGPSATRIWKAIYDENCFVNEEGPLAVDVVPTQSFTPPNEQCIEKRVFYRLISGLHSSITTHLTYEFSHDLSSQSFAPNVIRFYETVAKYPARIHNMYLTYLMLLRAVSKALPTFYRFDYKSDQTPQIQTLLHQLSQVTTTCPNTFDENVMFQGNDALALKSQFKNHFRNISVILDCVACERCKLWGKLQINGLGTALKILFDAKQHPEDETLQLERTELVALIHTLRRLSESLKWSNIMFKEYTTLHSTKHSPSTLDGTPLFGGEKGMDPHDSHDPMKPHTPNPSQADPHFIPLEATQVNEDADPHPQTEDFHPDPEIYAIPPPIPIAYEDKWLDEPSWQDPAIESVKAVETTPTIEASTLDHPEPFQPSNKEVDSFNPRRTEQDGRRSEEALTGPNTVHKRYPPPNEYGKPLEILPSPIDDSNSNSHTEQETMEEKFAQHESLQSVDANSIDDLPSQDSSFDSRFDQNNQRPDSNEAQKGSFDEAVYDQEISSSTASMDAETHHHDHEEQSADEHPLVHPELHQEHHHQEHHHHGMMGMDFGSGDSFGMGVGGHHGSSGHDIPSESRDLSSISSETWAPPDLEGFDLIMAYAFEYWRVAKVTTFNFYFGVIVPTLRENSSWYSGLAILFPVFLLFLLALRRQPDAFVPFEEPMYRRPASGKTSKGSSAPDPSSGISRHSNRPSSSSDQAFAPSPNFLTTSQNPAAQDPVVPLGAKSTASSKKTSSATRRPPSGAAATASLSHAKQTLLMPTANKSNSAVQSSSRFGASSSQPAGPGAIAPDSTLSHSPMSNVPESKPRRGGSGEPMTPTTNSAERSELNPVSTSPTSSTSQSTPSTSPFPMPTPGMRSTANAPKVVAPRPRRAVPVPGIK